MNCKVKKYEQEEKQSRRMDLTKTKEKKVENKRQKALIMMMTCRLLVLLGTFSFFGIRESYSCRHCPLLQHNKNLNEQEKASKHILNLFQLTWLILLLLQLVYLQKRRK